MGSLQELRCKGCNEDKSRNRTGHGAENLTPLRRLATGVIKVHGKVAAAARRKLR